MHESRYGARLRDFHARHEIKPDREHSQAAIFRLEPRRQRSQRSIIGWIALVVIGATAVISFEILWIEYTWASFIDGPPTQQVAN